jgi:hypothetical protein
MTFIESRHCKPRNIRAFDINTDIPLPVPTEYDRYPIERLEVGDCFFVPESCVAPKNVTHHYYKARKLGLNHSYTRRWGTYNGVDGTMVWRTA